MNRREKLILSCLNNVHDDQESRYLDVTVKIVLADLGKQFCQFWSAKGPGVMFFNPEEKRSMFYKTVADLYQAQETLERENDDDLAESFRRIKEAVEKINPEEQAGYVILDNTGMRLILIDYQKVQDGDTE